MPLAPSALKARFQEFRQIADTELQPWIDEAERNVCREAWRSRGDDGVLYLAAHLYAVFGAAEGIGAGSFGFGPVESKRVDQVQASYAIGDLFKNSDLGSTKYGRRYLALRRQIHALRCI